MPKRPLSGGLVYSTDAGRMCPGCHEPVGSCRDQLVSLLASEGFSSKLAGG